MMKNSQFTFSAVPSVSYRRSMFDLSHSLKTSMSLGKLYPICVTEVLPGDTFRCHTAQVCRLSTAFLRPVMDNCFMDVYYFFVPNRLTYDRWEEVLGENKKSAWYSSESVSVPTLPVDGSAQIAVQKGVADYIGIPDGVSANGLNLLPFRAFALIYDRWFRNENVIDPMNVQTGEFASSEALNGDAWSPANYTGQLPFVGKKKDYFTSCLPAPQKGPAVNIPVSGASGQSLPVYAGATIFDAVARSNPLEFGSRSPGANLAGSVVGLYSVADPGADIKYQATAFNQSDPPYVPSGELFPINLHADLSGLSGVFSSVNDMRFAFQLQKMYEKDARFGTRYNEYLLGHFGVSNPDARLQIPEYLGGARMPINVQQVAQTNTQQMQEQEVESPLAALGAYSHSVGKSRISKSFTEHGFLIAVACIRQVHTYQQGIERFWFRRNKTDYYDPLFANLGEQPVYQAELYRSTNDRSDIHDSPIFGYNEAWADYRYKPNRVSGEMRSSASNSLDVWHFADDYANAPVLSQAFIEETPEYFDRTVAVPSTSQDNFIVDFYFDMQRFSVMPTYSVPGLIDHH